MTDTKRRMENFSFYDKTGMERHLEQMAAKGWLLKRINSFGWVYERIEPKKVHFAVTHYPKATEFDPEMSEGQKTLQDFCEHAGWILAATSASMQFYYNEAENPLPIETDPQIELENVHAGMKKNYLPSYYILFGLAIFQLIVFFIALIGNPIATLSNISRVYSTAIWLLLVIVCTVEVGGYFAWYRKAKVAAEQGEFLATKGNRMFQNIVLAMVTVGMCYWFWSLGGRMERIIGVIGMFYVFLVIIIVNSAKNFMKRKKVSAGTNKTLTWVISFGVSFTLMGALTFILMRSISSGEFAKLENPEVETYEHMGYTFEVYHDELPVEIADLLDNDYEKYSTRWRVQETPFLAEYDAEQSPRMQDVVEQPSLEYTIVNVKMSVLYDMCFKELYYKYEDSSYNKQLPESERRRYVEMDAEPWKANAAYRVYSGEDAWDQYLICWNGCIVVFCPDWEMTEEQMQIVAERLQD